MGKKTLSETKIRKHTKQPDYSKYPSFLNKKEIEILEELGTSNEIGYLHTVNPEINESIMKNIDNLDDRKELILVYKEIDDKYDMEIKSALYKILGVKILLNTESIGSNKLVDKLSITTLCADLNGSLDNFSVSEITNIYNRYRYDFLGPVADVKVNNMDNLAPRWELESNKDNSNAKLIIPDHIFSLLKNEKAIRFIFKL